MFKKRFLGVLVSIFALSLVASLLVFADGPDNAKGTITFEPVQAVEIQTNADKNNLDEGEAIYFVQLMDPPLALYKGGVQGLAPTSNRVTGARILDVNSSASVAYMNHLESVQMAAISNIKQELARDVNVTYQYKATMNGFAMKLTADEAAKVAKMAGVKYVNKGLEYHPTTDHGPEWLGAPGIWDGSATGGLPGTKGEGVIVGVIDTGIDPWNPSFADIGGDGYDHTNPWGAGNYVGVCDSSNPSYDATFPCNDKLIGAWGYGSVHSGDPRDEDGHGSHTSSTAAGNVVYGATITTPTGVYTANISGVAPHANVVMYAACCTSDALAAAKEQVVLDGVDVVNYSIGANAGSDPEASYSTQWLAVRESGIFVATSAGNNGPGSATVGSPADLPWLTSVGANSHDRTFLNSLTVTGGASPLTVNGQSMTGALITPTKVVFSSWYTLGGTISADDARLCKDGIFPPGTFNGEIVVCERGAYGRVAKGQTVADGGAGGYILAQPTEVGGGPGALAPDPHVIPAVHIDYYEYQKLKDYMAANNNNIMGTIAGSTMAVGDQYGDIMASFSSRGPSRADGDGMASHIVPAVTAPGRGIWAAYHQGAADGDYTYNVIQGTSMSSPHVAGAGALLSALHPTWTPSEIESAMMLTARTPITDDNGLRATTPFTSGAGHVDLMAAGKTGLVMDIANGEYAATLPQNGGDPTALNRAALGNDQCLKNCSWQRTFKSTLATAATWTASTSADAGLGLTVDPASFTIPAGGTQVVTFTADASSLPYDEWVFGQVDFTSTAMVPGTGTFPASLVPAVHMPVAVNPTSGIYPGKVEINTRRNAGSVQAGGFETIAASELTIRPYGLVAGTLDTRMVDKDPTNGNPFDDLNGTGNFFVTVDVASTDVMLVAEMLASEAPDVDLYVGSGSTPSAATTLCTSATASWNEFCQLDKPAPGTYWILVQNWDSSASPPDEVTLSYAVVGSNVGNMTVTGPVTVAQKSPYTLTVQWDTPTMKEGDHWYGAFDVGSDSANPGNIGFIPVYVTRNADDVVKKMTMVKGDFDTGLEVTYVITVNANTFAEDLTYMLTDTIPAGMTYVPGSVTGGGVYSNGMITWNGTMPSLTKIPGRYVVSDNTSDPNCDTAFGGYTDLENFGIFPQPSISGDTKTWSAFSSQNPFQFYGVSNSGINFTDDGFAYFNSTPGSSPWANTNLPNADDPNDMLAPFWNDMEIVYDGTPGSVRGVSLASAGTDLSIIEYDDIQPWHGTDRFDFEIQMWSTIDNSPGAYEIMYAYDNLSTDDVDVTVGVENADATQATKYLFGNASGVITDGLVICFDYQGPPADPVVITYKASVDNPSTCDTFTNTVEHTVDNPGSKVATTDAEGAIFEVCPKLEVNTVGMGNVTLMQLGNTTPPLPTAVDDVFNAYYYGTEVKATAQPASGWRFVGWDGDSQLIGGSALFPEIQFIMKESKGITATFEMSNKLYLPLVFK